MLSRYPRLYCRGTVASLLLACSLGAGFSARQAWAQQPSLFFQASDALSTELERDAAYDQLAVDYEAFLKQSLTRRVVQLAVPTVVHIEARHSNVAIYGSRGVTEEAGSGVVIKLADKYFVLTNRHVIKESQSKDITIFLDDGRQVHPTLIRDDAGTDVAVMQIEAPHLVAARTGDSDEMAIGDFVIAVGSPFGVDLSQSVTYGIISGKGRHGLELGGDTIGFQDFIQTDAAINPGNSGGPLINLKGEVIGINTAIASASGGNEGIGLTIPINMAKAVALQLIERGRVERAFLGVNLDGEFSPSDAASLGMPSLRGARISKIITNSPAAEADLKVDDVVLEFDGVPIQNDNHLINLVSLVEVGREVSIRIFRDSRVIDSSVVVGRRSDYSQR